MLGARLRAMNPPLQLNAHEARLLGVLFEKERTVPDQYPLSLNALTAGANQKNNRAPTTDWSEAEVLVGLTGLIHKGLAGKHNVAGSRVEKFRHNAREALSLDDAKLALLAELLMRGPQTAGELRTRASRMCELGSLEQVASRIAALCAAGLARRIEPGPGSRVERWMQLLAPDLHAIDGGDAAGPTPVERAERRDPDAPSLAERVASLEARIAALERALGVG